MLFNEQSASESVITFQVDVFMTDKEHVATPPDKIDPVTQKNYTQYIQFTIHILLGYLA